jgi:hypothetical protein
LVLHLAGSIFEISAVLTSLVAQLDCKPLQPILFCARLMPAHARLIC